MLELQILPLLQLYVRTRCLETYGIQESSYRDFQTLTVESSTLPNTGARCLEAFEGIAKLFEGEYESCGAVREKAAQIGSCWPAARLPKELAAAVQQLPKELAAVRQLF